MDLNSTIYLQLYFWGVESSPDGLEYYDEDPTKFIFSPRPGLWVEVQGEFEATPDQMATAWATSGVFRAAQVRIAVLV